VVPRAYDYAALQTYHAYSDPRFLSMAQAVWEFGNAYTISPAQAAAGSFPGKDITLAQDCQSGKSVSPTKLKHEV
jgi:hypothetical protein